MDEKAQLGNALRALRKSKKWSLATVSEMTGISISTLSKVENGRLSLTYDKLMDLSKGLKVDISVFFASPQGVKPERITARRSIDSIQAGKIVDTPHYRHRYLSSDLSNKHIIPIIVEVKTRSIEEFGPLIRHDGEEFAYVLKGEIEVHTEFYEPRILKEGEFVYLDSNMGHAYICRSEEPAVFISACTSSKL